MENNILLTISPENNNINPIKEINTNSNINTSSQIPSSSTAPLQNQTSNKESNDAPESPIKAHDIYEILTNLKSPSNLDKIKSSIKTMKLGTKFTLLQESFYQYSQTKSPHFKEIISFLISQNVNINKKFDPKKTYNKNIKSKENEKLSQLTELTPLMFSVKLNDFDLVSMLINQGKADVSIKNHYSLNCLFYLFRNSLFSDNDVDIKIKISNEILNQQNIINITDEFSGKSILMEAIAKKNIKLIKYFIEKGANLCEVNCKNGNSILHYAVNTKNKEIIEYIISQIDNENGDYYICWKRNNDNLNPLDLQLQIDSQTEIYQMMVEAHNKCKIAKNKNQFYGSICMDTNNSSRLEMNFSFNNSTFEQYKENYGINNGNSAYEISKEINDTISSEENLNNFDDCQLNKIIKIESTPTLYLDISENVYKDELILESIINEGNSLTNEINNYQKILKNTLNENMNLKKEMDILNKELTNLNNEIALQTKKKIEQDNKNFNEYNELKNKSDKEKKNINILLTQIKHFDNKKSNYNEYIIHKFEDIQIKDIVLLQNLTKDIIEFKTYIDEKMFIKNKMINNLLNYLTFILRECNMDYDIKIFGSFALGLALPSSDLDLILIPKNMQINNLNNMKEANNLQNFYIKLQNSNYFHSPPKLIENFIFKFITINTGSEYDNIVVNISIQDNTHTGLQCVEYIRQYITMYKIIGPLLLVIKQMLKDADLLYYYGGLNSYGLFLMIAFLFQEKIKCRAYILNNLNDFSNLGKFFIDFLDFYINQFNPSNHLICLQNSSNQLDPETFDQIIKNDNELIIIDPLNKKNNVTERTYLFSSVKSMFKIAYSVAKEDCDCSCHYFLTDIKDDSLQIKEHSILKQILKVVKKPNDN